MNDIVDCKLVRNSMIGSELTEEKAKLLAAKMGIRHLKDGELLVEDGGGDSTLFILVSGALAVTVKDVDGKEKVYLMKEGECAGIRAFVDQIPRKGILRAVGEATVYTLTPSDFELLLDSYPRLAFKVMRALFRITNSNLSLINKENKELEKYVTKSLGRY